MEDIQEYFERQRRERAEREAETARLVAETVARGGVVRELGFGNFTDWSLESHPSYGPPEHMGAHLANRHMGFGTKLIFDPVINCVPFTPAEAVRAAKEAGHTHVKTFGGWIPIDEWATKRANFSISYEYDAGRARIREIPIPGEERMGALFLGLWTCGSGDDLNDLTGCYVPDEKEVAA